MTTYSITVTVNGRVFTRSVSASRRLVDFIREDIGLTGTKISCGVQVCGVCTVLVDGLPSSSCAFLAVDADGREITTVEGVSAHGELNEFQGALLRHGGSQCGYCTPGFVMTMEALLRDGPREWDEESIREALEGNICRCTGYRQILDAAASVLMRPSAEPTTEKAARA
jgi:aerobic-type carbon monoxide dehydrogenase small subunit (CoxS/CutS family)